MKGFTIGGKEKGMDLRCRAVLLLVFCALWMPVHAQDSLAVPLPPPYTWEDFVEEYVNDENHEDNEAWEARIEELKLLHEQPLNINTATEEDLLQLPFLSEQQIEDILADIYLNGTIRHAGMLRLPPSMDDDTWRKLLLFVYIGEGAKSNRPLKERLTKGMRHTLSTRTDIPLYYRKGYVTNNGYAGNPLLHRIRYQLTGSRHLAAGLRVEKDAGERYFDSYGAFVMFKNMGVLRQGIAGDYRCGFGEGVVMGSGGASWGSKSVLPVRQLAGPRPMTSMDEIYFFRGAAATFRMGKDWEATLLTSYRRLDATLNEEGHVRTLLRTGLHRTHTERERRNNVGAVLTGGHLGWKHGPWSAGCTGYYQQFSRPLDPGSQPYRRIYPRGRRFGVMGVHYAYAGYLLRASGETAYSTARSGWATLNRMSLLLPRQWTIQMLQRFYSYRYYSFHAAAFAEGSGAQNESGILLQVKGRLWPRWHLMTYADYFHHPWPRYQLTQSSNGVDVMCQLNWQCTPVHALEARHQFKYKMYANGYRSHHRSKLRWTATLLQRHILRTTLFFHQTGRLHGWGLQQTARVKIPHWHLDVNASCAAFLTDGYDARLFFYDPPLYASISTITYFGQGLAPALSCRWTSTDGRWMLEAKYRHCRYFDRDKQSSGLETIMGPRKQDISIGAVVRL